MSWKTRTCPSVPGPAPMPMVGIRSVRVTRVPTSVGTPSRTMLKAPACSSSLASDRMRAACFSVLPWTVNQMGGFKVQGKTEKQAARILSDAKELEQAGAFSIVLEGVPTEVGTRVTQALRIPTIGIGAGPGTDGQGLVFHDMLGLTTGKAPKVVERDANLAEEIARPAQRYVPQVR